MVTNQLNTAMNMKTSVGRKFLIYSLSLLLSFPLGIAQGQSTGNVALSVAGQVVMVTGDVTAQDRNGMNRKLGRKSEVYVGDTILTAPASRTQIRMVDSALIALQESTEFVVVDYNYSESTPADSKSTLDLIQGGLRTLSGKIGQENKPGYVMNAGNFATIGIRGTDYEVIITPSGRLFTGVYQGGTTVSNNFGVLNLGAGALFDFAEVATPQSPPEGINLQPDELGQIDISVGEDDEDDTDNGSPAAPASNGNAVNTPAAATNNNTQNDLGNSSFADTNLITSSINTGTGDGGSAGLSLAASNGLDNASGAPLTPNETNGNGLLSCADGVGAAACSNGNPGNSGNGNGNADNSGNGNSGSSNGNNNGNGNSDTSGNGNSGSGGNGNGNGSNTDTASVSDSSDSSGSDSTGKGNGKGNGKGGSGGVLKSDDLRLQLPDSSLATYSISWGPWNNPVASNWVSVSRNEVVAIVSTSEYMATVNPSELAGMQGQYRYGSTPESNFVGQGNLGAVTDLVAGFEVDFSTGTISNGNLLLRMGNQDWAVDFNGQLSAGIAQLNPVAGQISSDGAVLSNAVDASLGGVFTGNTAESFVGGFDLVNPLDPTNQVNGLFTLER